VLEGKLKIGKQLGGKHKFGRLQTVENSAKLAVGKTTYFFQQRERDVVSDDRRLLQQLFSAFGSASIRAARTACTVGGISFPEIGLTNL